MTPRATGEKEQELPPELPPRDTRRWVASRKAAVVWHLNKGTYTTEQLMERYGLTEEELQGWKSAHQDHGRKGLLATKIQQHRKTT